MNERDDEHDGIVLVARWRRSLVVGHSALSLYIWHHCLMSWRRAINGHSIRARRFLRHHCRGYARHAAVLRHESLRCRLALLRHRCHMAMAREHTIIVIGMSQAGIIVGHDARMLRCYH